MIGRKGDILQACRDVPEAHAEGRKQRKRRDDGVDNPRRID